MLIQLNTYEGVPVGSNNFEDVLDYVNGFLSANFEFSTNVTSSANGGFFDGDDFIFGSKGNFKFITPQVKDKANLYMKRELGFVQDEVSNATGTNNPHIYEWQLIPETSELPTGNTLQYSNIDVNTSQLPYRPVRLNEATADFDYGIQGVTFNGIPQPRLEQLIGGVGTKSYWQYTYNLSNVPLGSYVDSVFSLNSIRLGAEFPKPVLNNRFDSNFLVYVDNVYNPQLTLNDFETLYDSTVQFEHTNFGIDFGGHILLYRETALGEKFYSYISQDLSSGTEVTSGKYKVLDYTRGVIKLNISSSNLDSLRLTPSELDSTVDFTVISAEQLAEEDTGNAINYHSNYGSVYDGDSSQVILLEYFFDGSNVVNTIDSGLYTSTSGSILLRDAESRFADSVVLAIRYDAFPNRDALLEAQVNKYNLDTLKLYYSPGIEDSVADSDIRGIVLDNNVSWYNRDILDAEYFPVARALQTNFNLVTINEVMAISTGRFADAFDPDSTFTILATVSLVGLSDTNIVSPVTGEVLQYDGSTWINSTVDMEELGDVTFTGLAVNDIIYWNGSEFVNSPISDVFYDATSTVVADTLVLRDAFGKAEVADLAFSDVGTTIANKNAVDDVADDLINHVSDLDAHGALSTASANRIVVRDTAGKAQISTPVVTDSGLTIANKSYVDTTMLDHQNETSPHNATSNPVVNTIMQRTATGTSQVQTPVVPEDIANKAYVDSATGSIIWTATSQVSSVAIVDTSTISAATTDSVTSLTYSGLAGTTVTSTLIKSLDNKIGTIAGRLLIDNTGGTVIAPNRDIIFRVDFPYIMASIASVNATMSMLSAGQFVRDFASMIENSSGGRVATTYDNNYFYIGSPTLINQNGGTDLEFLAFDFLISGEFV